MKIIEKGACGAMLILLGVMIGGVMMRHEMNNDTILINGRRVTVVDVMYKYQNEDDKEVRGDYSLVSENGYEYTEDGSYTKEYQDAVVRK